MHQPTKITKLPFTHTYINFLNLYKANPYNYNCCLVADEHRGTGEMPRNTQSVPDHVPDRQGKRDCRLATTLLPRAGKHTIIISEAVHYWI